MVRIGTRSGVSNSSDTFLLDRFRDGTIEHTDAILLTVHGPTGPLPRRRRDIPKVGVEEWKGDSMGGSLDRDVLRHPQRPHVAGAIHLPIPAARANASQKPAGTGCSQQSTLEISQI